MFILTLNQESKPGPLLWTLRSARRVTPVGFKLDAPLPLSPTLVKLGGLWGEAGGLGSCLPAHVWAGGGRDPVPTGSCASQHVQLPGASLTRPGGTGAFCDCPRLSPWLSPTPNAPFSSVSPPDPPPAAGTEASLFFLTAWISEFLSNPHKQLKQGNRSCHNK